MPAKKRTVKTAKTDNKLFNYLLVQYLKEMSNELTYLLLVVAALFLFMIIDVIPDITGEPMIASYAAIRAVFIILVVGGFFMFGISNATKRRIERQMLRILS